MFNLTSRILILVLFLMLFAAPANASVHIQSMTDIPRLVFTERYSFTDSQGASIIPIINEVMYLQESYPALKDFNIHIYLLNKKGYIDNYWEVGGVYSPTMTNIYLFQHDRFNPRYVVAHELGHFVRYNTVDAVYSPEEEELFADNFAKQYGSQYAQEKFIRKE